MSKVDILASLRAVETELYSRKVQQWVRKLPSGERSTFNQARLRFTRYVDKVKQAALQDIVDELEANEKELEKAIDSLDQVLDDVKTFKKAIDGIAKIVGLLGKVIGVLPV